MKFNNIDAGTSIELNRFSIPQVHPELDDSIEAYRTNSRIDEFDDIIPHKRKLIL
jgi:hypothetical protein